MPRCVSFNWKSGSGTIEFASAPSSTHTMKLMSKYRKAQNSDGVCPTFRNERTFMHATPREAATRSGARANSALRCASRLHKTLNPRLRRERFLDFFLFDYHRFRRDRLQRLRHFLQVHRAKLQF